MTAFAASVGFLSGISSLMLTGIVRWYATHRNMLDIPNARSSHASPTPRGGGLGIVATFSLALLVCALYRQLDVRTVVLLMVCGAVVAVAGILDDRHSLPARVRFAVHALAAGIFVALMGHVPDGSLIDFGPDYRWMGAAIVVMALIWSTNLFNFMDGIDGIAGSEAAFVSGAGAWINSWQQGDPGLTAAMICLCGAALGFLAWNWPPARIFMGDVGSGYIGLMLPMLGFAASQRAAIPLQVWLILGGVFLVDATATLFRRVLRGDRWFEAHRLHAYQHSARRWKGHLPVTVLVSALNLLWLFPWALYAARVPKLASVCLGAALTPLLILTLVGGAGRPERTSVDSR
jgi:Fuc2NAc and GlcNAc transferase